MNASYRVGNKKTMMNQIYKVDSNNGTPLRVALDKATRDEVRVHRLFDDSVATHIGSQTGSDLIFYAVTPGGHPAISVASPRLGAPAPVGLTSR